MKRLKINTEILHGTGTCKTPYLLKLNKINVFASMSAKNKNHTTLLNHLIIFGCSVWNNKITTNLTLATYVSYEKVADTNMSNICKNILNTVWFLELKF